MPTKSVCPCCGLATVSFHSDDPWPKTCVMSPVESVLLFSSSMFAVPTPPTSQPARVKGTHGAGVVAPVSVIMFGFVSATGSTGLVQYLDDDVLCGTVAESK